MALKPEARRPSGAVKRGETRELLEGRLKLEKEDSELFAIKVISKEKIHKLHLENHVEVNNFQ